VKTVGDAVQLGNELITRFEQAASEPDIEERQKLLHVVVIGGGFSGVEVAGQLRDLMREIHPFYPQLKQVTPAVTLIQHGDRVIPELNHQSLSDFGCLAPRRQAGSIMLPAMLYKSVTGSAWLRMGGLEYIYPTPTNRSQSCKKAIISVSRSSM
jgi:hypothetical protein